MSEASTSVRWFWGLLGGLTVLRLLLAANVPLTPDEAYYWVWSRSLQCGYLDHPFMVALWIRAGTWIAGNTPLGVRLLGPLSVLPGSWALYHAARRLLPSFAWPQSGLKVALLLNATLMLGLGAATMTPDTPLLFFVTLFLYTLSRAIDPTLTARGAIPWWLGSGILLGLAFDSKYTAVLIGLGLGGAVLSTARLRRQPGPWLAIPALAVTMLPVILWNAHNHWASFLRQGGRAGDWRPARAMQFIGELLGGQIGLATPLIFILFVMGLWACIRRNRLLAWMALVPVVVFGTHALGDRVQPNWPAVIYPVLALAALEAGWRIKPAVISGFLVTLFVSIQALFSPLHLIPHRDPVLRLTGGWSAFSKAVALKARSEGATALAVDDYGLAARLAFTQNILPVVGTDSRWRLFRFPSTSSPRAIRIEEQRHAAPVDQSATLCRNVRGQPIRCYSLSSPEEVVGAQLPGPS
ncbi:ArnT family glycosyltransferase [Gluconobacter kanchanaburiensis]|uniref:Glycosyl transferase n=1 Tax=Gluconobacter kanchanaburiensis NBRC 103587 TaxID=1307948 RepID=A0A511BA94_9PROT|nr:glycosyltransferase family 39 protein [Gluconobacter kanchanaburiensis]GEK97330.1 glycosyl transferase [Gluconobacter kanchanaburiensis NBRC 103587]